MLNLKSICDVNIINIFDEFDLQPIFFSFKLKENNSYYNKNDIYLCVLCDYLDQTDIYLISKINLTHYESMINDKLSIYQTFKKSIFNFVAFNLTSDLSFSLIDEDAIKHYYPDDNIYLIDNKYVEKSK